MAGQTTFYGITNKEIFDKINEMDKSITHFKAVVYALTLVITPLISSIIALLVSRIG